MSPLGTPLILNISEENFQWLRNLSLDKMLCFRAPTLMVSAAIYFSKLLMYGFHPRRIILANTFNKILFAQFKFYLRVLFEK